MYTSNTLVANIKTRAKEKNVLIRDMLNECGLSINAISQISDKKGLSSFSLARIADYLDCSVDYLLGRTERPEVQKDSTLSQRDKTLLEAVHRLNNEGREKVETYANDLADNEKYIWQKNNRP